MTRRVDMLAHGCIACPCRCGWWMWMCCVSMRMHCVRTDEGKKKKKEKKRRLTYRMGMCMQRGGHMDGWPRWRVDADVLRACG